MERLITICLGETWPATDNYRARGIITERVSIYVTIDNAGNNPPRLADIPSQKFAVRQFRLLALAQLEKPVQPYAQFRPCSAIRRESRKTSGYFSIRRVVSRWHVVGSLVDFGTVEYLVPGGVTNFNSTWKRPLFFVDRGFIPSSALQILCFLSSLSLSLSELRRKNGSRTEGFSKQSLKNALRS